MTNRIKMQLTLTIFWFASAYFAIGAISSWEWAWRCAWLNVIIGLVGLLFITRTEIGDKLFYDGPAIQEEGSLKIALLWAIPMSVLLMAGIWWGIRLLIRLFGG